LDLSRGNEGQGVRDGEHGTALDQAVEPRPSAAPEFPGTDHDERGGILRWLQRQRLAVQGEALTSYGAEQLLRRWVVNRRDDRLALLDQCDGNAVFRQPVHIGFGTVDRVD